MSTRSVDRKPDRTTLWAVVIIGFLVGFAFWSKGVFSGKTDTTVPVPELVARQATVEELRHAAQAQGVCYGWTLADGFHVGRSSVGSNVGDGSAVDHQPSCPRWVQVRATVYYTDETSEASDSATVEITSSPDMSAQLPTSAALDRLGLDEGAFVDSPDDAILLAAMALPLLVHEAGLAAAVPRRTTAATAAPGAPLDEVGNDLWRSRWLPLATAMVLIVLAGAGLVVGWLRRGGPRDKPEPAHPPDAVLSGAKGTGQVRPSVARRKARRSRRRRARRS